MRFFTDIFTDDQGDFSIVVAMSVAAMVFYMAMTGYNVFWLHKDVTYTDWAAGAGALIVSLGGAWALQRKPKDTQT